MPTSITKPLISRLLVRNLSFSQITVLIYIYNIKPGRWHNGSAFVFCSCGCTFESEPSPTSAHACGEVTSCAPAAKRSASGSTRGESWGMYITFASTIIVNKAEPTLDLKPRGDVTRNPKQGYQWPQKRTCVRQKLFKKKKKKVYI